MTIKTFVFNPFYENTYVIHDKEKNAMIVDPGCYEDYEKDALTSYIDSEGLKVKLILNTHCHIDHVLGNHFLKEKYAVPLAIPEGELGMLEAQESYATMWGINYYAPSKPDQLLKAEPLEMGSLTFQSLLAPGHSPGHLTFYHEATKTLLGGDVLFRESIGRTDLPGGNHEQLLQSIREQLFVLPEDTTVYSGHGPVTTIAHEKQFNPFLQ